MHRSVTDNRVPNRYYVVAGIPTLNFGIAGLHTGDDALVTVAQFFTGMANMPRRFGRCTCCHEPRMAVQIGGENEEWMHLDDEHYAEMRHIHVESCQRDCDGTWPDEHTLRLTSIRPEALAPSYLEREPEFRDLWRYVVAHEPREAGYRLTITVEDGVLDWHTQTDEGYHGGHARVCAESYCAHDDRRR